LTVYHFSSCFVSKGPMSMSITTLKLPLKAGCTRHECLQMPPQPYLNRPAPITLPLSLMSRNAGAGSHWPFFFTPGTYFSPACPFTVTLTTTVRPYASASGIISSGGPGSTPARAIVSAACPFRSCRLHVSPFASCVVGATSFTPSAPPEGDGQNSFAHTMATIVRVTAPTMIILFRATPSS